MRNNPVRIFVLLLAILCLFSTSSQAAGSTAITITVTIAEAEIIPATVEFQPKIIGLRQRYLRCYIELPSPYKVENIVVNTVALTEVNGNPISPPLKTIGRSKIADFDRDGIFDLEVWFDIRSIIQLLKAGENSLTAAGNLKEDKRFQGTGTLRLRK